MSKQNTTYCTANRHLQEKMTNFEASTYAQGGYGVLGQGVAASLLENNSGQKDSLKS
jgi:hypothetical protein